MLGFLLRKLGRTDISLTTQEGGIVVTLSWLCVVLFSAIPFMMVDQNGLTSAIFESASGWTTTGITVMDVAHMPHVMIFWRSFLQYLGGAGLAIIMLSALVGVVGVGITSAEGRRDQVLPQVHQSARLVLIMYVGYAVVGTLTYILAGMPWFDAINHAFTAVATGGFSSIPSDFSYWNSLLIEWITIVLMLLGNLSFVTAWALFRGKFRVVFRNAEVRLVLVLLPVAIGLLTYFTFLPVYSNFGTSLRHACFEATSVLTTTGLSTVPFETWNSFGIAMMMGLMLIGGGTCSTAGGIRQMRFVMILRLISREFRQLTGPKRAIVECVVSDGVRPFYVDDSAARHCLLFVLLYLCTVFCGSLILCTTGVSFEKSLFEISSAITSMGFTSGVTTLESPPIVLWTEIAAMLLGRLEIIVIFASFIRIRRDVPRMFVFHR